MLSNLKKDGSCLKDLACKLCIIAKQTSISYSFYSHSYSPFFRANIEHIGKLATHSRSEDQFSHLCLELQQLQQSHSMPLFVL